MLIAGLIVLTAYFIRGITGFGSGLIAVPLLVHFLPFTFVVPLILVTDLFASVVLGTHTRRHARWDEVRPLLLFSAIGVTAGTLLLISLPKTPLLAALGVFVLLFGVRDLLALNDTHTISRWWALPAGLVGGTVSALFGTGGPPYVIYLNHRLRNKGERRATFSLLFLIEGGTRLAAFLLAGLFLERSLLLVSLSALPLVAAGLWLGNHVHLTITPRAMQRLVGVLLVAAGDDTTTTTNTAANGCMPATVNAFR